LTHVRHTDSIDFDRFIVETGCVHAVGGGEETGPSPVACSNIGSKFAIVNDGQGVPSVIDTIPANTPDPNATVPLVDAIPPIAGQPGHPPMRPGHVIVDEMIDDEERGWKLRNRGIDRELAKSRTPHSSGLGVYRWVIERTISWFHQFRWFRVRHDPRDNTQQRLRNLAGTLIIYRLLVLNGLT
jgi:hypothetical protein